MPYKITIVQIDITEYEELEPVLVEKIHYTDAEMGERSYIGRQDRNPADFLREKYEKIPKKKFRRYSTELLEQTVQDLDVSAVIKAINKL